MRPPSPPRLSLGTSPESATVPRDRAGVRADAAPRGRATLAVREAGEATERDGDATGAALEPVGPGGGSVAAGSVTTGSVTSAFSERLAERFAARRRLTRVRVAVLAAGAAVVAGVAYLVLASPVLALHSDAVRIEGTGTVVDPTAVAALAAAQDGTPLARLDVPALEARIGRLNGVKSVDVARAWPDGLDVAIVSREPVAVVARDEGFAFLDPEGVQVAVADRAPDALPVVDIPLGGRSADALSAVLTVLGALPPELLGQVSGAGASSADTVHFRLADGARVEWGSADSPALKIRVLEVLRQRPASVYDVSAPTMPVTR